MKYLYAALVGMALVAGAYFKGVIDTNDKWEAKAASVRTQDVQIARDMEPQLQHTLTVTKTKTVTLTHEVPVYVDRYLPAPGASTQARPVYYLTWGAVWLWNDALSASPTPYTVGAPTGPNPLELSPVSFDQAEANAITNFGQYADCRTIVAGWQEWYARVSKVKP